MATMIDPGHMLHKHGFFPYLRALRKGIMASGIEFDSIAVTGISGIGIGPALAAAMGKHVVIVRKEGEQTNSFNRIEFIGERINIGCPGRYIFVDDLIDSGATLMRVQQEIGSEYPYSKLVAVALYQNRWFKDEDGSRCLPEYAPDRYDHRDFGVPVLQCKHSIRRPSMIEQMLGIAF